MKFTKRYDETNIHWDNNYTFNRLFLESTRNFLNNTLNYAGFVTLYQVYDCIKFRVSKESLVYGWNKKNGDNVIRMDIIPTKDEKSFILIFDCENVMDCFESEIGE